MRNIHITKHKQEWWAKEEKTSEPMSVFQKQSDAVVYGTRIAKVFQTELFIHGRDGRIRERNTFGRDPFPPKG